MNDWLLPQLSFRQPLWLLLMPLCWMLWWLRSRRTGLPARFRAYADPRLLDWLLVESSGPGRSRLILFAWLLIVAGIGGPQLVTDGDRQQSRKGIDIAVIVDISPSMRVADVAPDRLRRVRLELDEFLPRLGADRTALIAFSAHAYRLLPLSTDTALLPWYLDALDPALTRLRGSNLTAALELAAQTLGSSGGHRAILLLSDGEAAEPSAALATADRLAARGVPVFALGIGTRTGGPIPASNGYLRGEDGEFVVSRLDRSLLEHIANLTGGRYAGVRADDQDWDQLFAGLDALDRVERAAPAADNGLPLGPVLFALALGLLMISRLRLPQPALALPVSMFCMMLAPAAAEASPWAERAALNALETGHYRQAAELYADIEGFRGRLGEGAAAYRLGRWQQALHYFNAAESSAVDDRQRAAAIYNQANTLARLGQLKAARDGYDQALRLYPNHQRAARNRAVVEHLLDRRTMPGAEHSEAPRREDPVTGSPLASGEVQHPDATGRHRDQQAAAGQTPGSGVGSRPRPGGFRLQLDQPLGEQAESALARIDALGDDAGEVLRHRFTVLDAEHQFIEQPRPW